MTHASRKTVPSSDGSGYRRRAWSYAQSIGAAREKRRPSSLKSVIHNQATAPAPTSQNAAIVSGVTTHSHAI